MSLRRTFSLLCLALLALFVLSTPFVRAEEEHDGDDGAADAGTQVRSVRYSAEELAAAQAAQAAQAGAAGYIEADWVFPDHADLST